MFKQALTHIKSHYYFWTSFTSLVALFFVFMKDAYAVVIAALTFNVVVGAMAIRVIHLFNQYTKDSYPSEFAVNSWYIRYSTQNAQNIIFDSYKHIQCKRAIASEYKYLYKWSGSQKPAITSELQQIDSCFETLANNISDHAVLKLREPLFYNQTAVTHVRLTCDDADRRSSTHIGLRVEEPIDVVHFRVDLPYKPQGYNQPAVLKKKRISAQTMPDYEIICSVPFDAGSKCYENYLFKPDLGYFYVLAWER